MKLQGHTISTMRQWINRTIVKLSILLLFSISCNLIATFPAYASIKPSSTLDITKTILNPQNNQYANSLGLSDYHFHPGDTVVFHITINNKSNLVINKVTVKDLLPSYLVFVSGPGQFTANSRTLTIITSNFAANTTQTFAITTKISDLTAFPAGQEITCTANKATATGDTTTEAQEADTPFCIESTQTTITPAPPVNVSTTPPTGPEALPLISLMGSAIVGFLFKKLSKGVIKI